MEGDTAAVDASLAHALQGTALGVRLEPGERVLFFVAPSHAGARVLCVVLGVLLSVLVFGLALIAYGLLYDRWALRFVVLTNRRLVAKKGDRGARSIDLADVVALRARRPATGRLLEPASLASHSEREAQMEAAHWTTADALLVQGKRGSLAIDRSAELERLGPALARAAFDPGWVDRAPTANAPP